MASKKPIDADVTPDADPTLEIESGEVAEPTTIFDTERLETPSEPAPVADPAAPRVAETTGRRPMRGTAIAWGIILLLVAAIGWFVGTVDFWQTSTEQILATVIIVGAVLVGVGILGAIIRAVTKR